MPLARIDIHSYKCYVVGEDLLYANYVKQVLENGSDRLEEANHGTGTF